VCLYTTHGTQTRNRTLPLQKHRPEGSRGLLHLRPRSRRLESAARPGPARTHCGDFEPMNIPQNHVALLMELCYTEPEARFLYVVATHSGYFILRQFLNFIDARRGKRSNLFARKVLNNGHGSVRSAGPMEKTEKRKPTHRTVTSRCIQFWPGIFACGSSKRNTRTQPTLCFRR
jgi:hypothetical protein